jgi:hypothetical protein
VTVTELSRCHGIQAAIFNVRLYFPGAPELGLDSFEPLLISSLIIGEGSGPVNVQQNFKNVKLHGLTGSIVSKHK